MPKGKRKPQAGIRPPSLRGAIVIDEYNGKPRTRAWPRPRGPNRHPTNRQWSDWLKAVTFLWRYQPAKVQAQLMRATKGTPWMARDPFISAFRGRAWTFTDQHGRTYYPMPVREAVSQSLDAVAQIAGQMLWRNANGWQGTAPPDTAGHVLTVVDPDAVPEWRAPAGGGGGVDWWEPNAPPAEPHASDDEFDQVTPSVPSGWLLADPSATATVLVDAAGLVATVPSSAGEKVGGIAKDTPAGDFTFWTRAHLLGRRSSTYRAGVCLWEDATDPTKRIYFFGLRATVAGVALVHELYTSYSAAPNVNNASNVVTFSPTSSYLRVRRSGSSWRFDYSDDGLSWVTHHPTSLLFSPDHIGPAWNAVAPGVTTAARFTFARFVEGDVGETGLMQGARG